MENGNTSIRDAPNAFLCLWKEPLHLKLKGFEGPTEGGLGGTFRAPEVQQMMLPKVHLPQIPVQGWEEEIQ